MLFIYFITTSKIKHMKSFPTKYEHSLTVENSWNEILVNVFEDEIIETKIETVSTETLLVEKKISELDITWLKKRDQYRLTDGLGNTFLPDDNFSYRMIIGVLQNIVGLLIFCTVMKDLYPIELLINEDFLSLEPRLRSAIISTILTLLTIIASFIYSVIVMLKGKKRFSEAKEKYKTQRQILLNQINQKQ